MTKHNKPRPLTDGMVAILKALNAGKPPTTVWASGRAHSGGLTTAMGALHRRGLITGDYKLTDAGRAAIGVPVVEAPSGGVVWTPKDEARLDAAIAKRNAARAARVNPACGVHGSLPCEGAGCICAPGVKRAAVLIETPHGRVCLNEGPAALPGLATLENVIQQLRMEGFYRDDEGEATGHLEDLLTAARSVPGTQADERMRHDYPILQQFHTKHALGALAAPSCLCCGHQTHPITRPIAVRHMELPAIVVCKQCKDAAAGVTPSAVPSTEGHSAILQLASDRCPCERCEADRRTSGAAPCEPTLLTYEEIEAIVAEVRAKYPNSQQAAHYAADRAQRAVLARNAGVGATAPIKRWPFVETPGEFTERLVQASALFNGDVLAAVRHVLIENPPTLARGVGGTLDGLSEVLLELRPMTAYGVVGSRDVDQARYRAAIDRALLELTAKNGNAAAIDKLAALAVDVPRKITSLAEFCAEAERLGLTAADLVEPLSKRPEFADCLPGNAGVDTVQGQQVRKCLYCDREMIVSSECLSKAQSESCEVLAGVTRPDSESFSHQSPMD